MNRAEARDLPSHWIEADRLNDAADRLAESILADPRTHYSVASGLPDRHAIIEVLNHLEALMYPGYFGTREFSTPKTPNDVRRMLDRIIEPLHEQIADALQHQSDVKSNDEKLQRQKADSEREATKIISGFLDRLPHIRRLLSLDVQAAFDGDPAARHTDETIFCYPGIRALTVHRLAHELYKLHTPLLPRLMQEHAHSITGIDIHPGAKIAASFFIDHGTGVVIGETTIIGDHCKLYQGVTLGAKSFLRDIHGRLKRNVKRHPTLEDHVTVYAGATILGGDTVIGAGSVINGGVFLTQSVPPGHVVRGPKADITLRNNPEMPPASYNI